MPTSNYGGVPGVNTPNEKAPPPSKVQGAFQITNTVNFPTAAQKCQAIAHQIAALALAGHHVHKGTDGDYLVCKYGLSRWCMDFAELQAFSKKLGVQ